MEMLTTRVLFALTAVLALSSCGTPAPADPDYGDLQGVRDRIVAFEQAEGFGANEIVVDLNLQHLGHVVTEKFAKLDPDALRFGVSSTVHERELTDGDIETELRGDNPVRGNFRVRSVDLSWDTEQSALGASVGLALELKVDLKGHVRVLGVRTPFQTTANMDASRTLQTRLTFASTENAWLDVAAALVRPDSVSVSYSVDVVREAVQIKDDFGVGLPVGKALLAKKVTAPLTYQFKHAASPGVTRTISATISPIDSKVRENWLRVRGLISRIETVDHAAED